MTGKASRLRFRLGGAAVAALLMISPVVGGHGVAAQRSSDIDPDAAQELLDQAESLAGDAEPILESNLQVVTQDAEIVAGYYVTDEGDPVSDFYLEFTVEMPPNGDDEPFDFGSIFRLVDDDNQYRLIFLSDDSQGNGPYWVFSQGTDEILSDSLDPDLFETTRNATYDVVLAAIGDEAAFSLNGEPLAVLDISDVPDPGDVLFGSGFFDSTSIADRDIDFSDISFYSLDDTSSTRTEGDAYVSPTYGYSLEYDDTWQLTDTDDNPGSGLDLTQDGIDIADADSIMLNNGVSTVVIYGGESTATPEDCVQGDIEFFHNTDAYDFFSIAEDTNGDALEGETTDGDGYYAVIWVTNTSNNVDTTVYIECRPFDDGNGMLLIEHYAADDEYNDQIDMREELLAGLTATGTGAVTPEPDETPTEEASGGDIEVVLDPVGRSDVEGEAVISASGTTRSTVDVVAPSAPEGALVVVQEGSCDDLSGEPDFDAGVIDENGESSDRIRITPDELDGNYALTIVDADTEDYEEPLACGNIG